MKITIRCPKHNSNDPLTPFTLPVERRLIYRMRLWFELVDRDIDSVYGNRWPRQYVIGDHAYNSIFDAIAAQEEIALHNTTLRATIAAMLSK